MLLRTIQPLPSLSRTYTTSTMAAPSAPIKPSASLLLLSPTNQILLMTRPKRPQVSFRGAVVFPGGALSPSDNSDYRVCALREVFEECGVLLLKDKAIYAGGPEGEWVQKARREVHSGKREFGDVLKEVGGEADLEGCVPFTRWITPKNLKRRFDTQMFLYMLDESKGKAVEDGKVESQELPKGDGGIEVVSTTFMDIEKALELNKAGEITFFPPQFYLLSVLKNFVGKDVHGSVAEKRERLRKYLASSDFGGRIMTPQMHGVLNGKTILGFGPKGGSARLLLKNYADSGPRELEILQDGLEIAPDSKL